MANRRNISAILSSFRRKVNASSIGHDEFSTTFQSWSGAAIEEADVNTTGWADGAVECKNDQFQVIAEHKSQSFVFALAGFEHHTELRTCDPPRLIFD
jgi:hypothetical protein